MRALKFKFIRIGGEGRRGGGKREKDGLGQTVRHLLPAPADILRDLDLHLSPFRHYSIIPGWTLA